MAAWILVPCLVSLRGEFNALAPDRDKASDGSIGDQAHAGSSSDHNPDETGNTPFEDSDSTNEVHAIDVDKELRRSGWTMQRAVDIIVTRHRAGLDNRLQNVIYNNRIWSRSTGWNPRPYGGSNPHTEHAHFSAVYTTAQERDTRPWGLLAAQEEEDIVTPAERTAIAQETVSLLLRTDLGEKGGGDTVGVALQTGAYQNTRAILRIVTGLAAAVAGLDDVDETALATALAPAVATLITPALVAAVEANAGLPLTGEQVEEAVKAALREGTA